MEPGKQIDLTTAILYEMPMDELNNLADTLGMRLLHLKSTGKDAEMPEKFKRSMLELYHISEVIEAREKK